MGVFGAVVEVTADLLAASVSDFFHGGPVGADAVCNSRVWYPVSLHRFTNELQGCGFISHFS
jgi:hypothetical protein